MINNVHFSSASNEWETPQELFNELNKHYRFTLDPCSTDQNHKCDKYYTIKDNGLEQDWSNDVVFCNPPYGREIGKWVKKAYEEYRKGSVVIMLIPSRTDTAWFHDYIYGKFRVKFLRGRLKFINRESESFKKDGKLDPAPFPSMLVFFERI